VKKIFPECSTAHLSMRKLKLLIKDKKIVSIKVSVSVDTDSLVVRKFLKIFDVFILKFVAVRIGEQLIKRGYD
jgi:hypothetical protein